MSAELGQDFHITRDDNVDSVDSLGLETLGVPEDPELPIRLIVYRITL